MTLNILIDLRSRNSRYSLLNYKTVHESFYHPMYFTFTPRTSSWDSQIRYVFSLGLPLSIQCIPLSDTGSLICVNVDYWIIKQNKSVMKQLVWWHCFGDRGGPLQNNLAISKPRECGLVSLLILACADWHQLQVAVQWMRLTAKMFSIIKEVSVHFEKSI